MSFEDMADSAANPKNLPVEFTFDESLVRTVLKDGEALVRRQGRVRNPRHRRPEQGGRRLDDDETGYDYCSYPWRAT